MCYPKGFMAYPNQPKHQTDDDAPRLPHPINDALSSAQSRRYQKQLLEENDRNYSD